MSACARLWQGNIPSYLHDLIIVGEQLMFLNLNGHAESALPAASDIFDRSLAVTGAGALFRLSKARIAIIGLSGTGSLMAELLMRAGAGELVLFEFDPADRTNLGRVLPLRASDAASRLNKAHRIAQVVARIRPPHESDHRSEWRHPEA
jgi:molybdopterin/thiamine biosynthesis adenylyltransferase